MSEAMAHEVLEAWAERVADPVEMLSHHQTNRTSDPEPAVPVRQGRPWLRRVLEPLDTCPPNLRSAHAGDCADCGRPIAGRRAMVRLPELTRWFLYRSAHGVCQGCRSNRDREHAPLTPRSRPSGEGRPRGSHGIKQAAARGPVSPERLAYLRALIPCLGCGATLVEDEDGRVSMPHRADCATARIVERRA